jgi:hypothetical protein
MREAIRGTHISESKVSERPKSVRMGLKDEVVMKASTDPICYNLVV